MKKVGISHLKHIMSTELSFISHFRFLCVSLRRIYMSVSIIISSKIHKSNGVVGDTVQSSRLTRNPVGKPDTVFHLVCLQDVPVYSSSL